MITYRLTVPLSGGGHGGSATPDVATKWDVGLNGIGYMIDTDPQTDPFATATITALRQSFDQGALPSEQSLSRENLWLRSQESWELGAGQEWADRTDSDRNRFRASKGIDCWTRWKLQLLNDTSIARASGNSNVRMVVAGTHLYIADGQTLLYTTDGTTFTTVTGTPANTISSLTTDGYNIWAAYGPGGLWTTTRGAATATQTVTTALAATAVIGFALGRLMVGNLNNLYNVTTAGPAALPAALITAPVDYVFTAITAGVDFIYAGGYVGDKSTIYSVTIKPDGTGLNVPYPAEPLPDGEQVTALQGYVGKMLIGLNNGFRFAEVGSAGALDAGARVITTSPVLCFEPHERFAWYGLTNYDSTSTGLGRMDLTQFTAPNVCAYASDLMTTTQGPVQSVVTFLGKRWYTIASIGVITETATPVPAGTLDTGLIGFGLAFDKLAAYADMQYGSFPGGSFSLAISNEGSAFSTVGTDVAQTFGAPFPLNQRRGHFLEGRVTVTSVTGLYPVLSRLTFRAWPSVPRGDDITVPILLSSKVVCRNGQEEAQDTQKLWLGLKKLADNTDLVQFAEGTSVTSVYVADIKLVRHDRNDTFWECTALLRLKALL